MRTIVIALLTTAALLRSTTAAERPYKKDAGPHEIAVVKLDWKDQKRDREVPVTIYAPKAGSPLPVIIFSHGLGGTRDGYGYIGRHWASHGYVSVHLQHHGSDDAVWKGSKEPLVEMKKAVKNIANSVNRALDVRFALDELERLNRDDAVFKGRLDLSRGGVTGHSFGGWTTQAVAGQVFVLPAKEMSLGDPRVKAAVIMSPSPAPGKMAQDKAFGSVKVPCLHLTGTKDDGVGVTEVKASERRMPFDSMTKSDQYLMIFKDGDHMIYANVRGKGPRGPRDERFLDLIRMSTTAFWDAYLCNDAAAKAWLNNDLVRELAADGSFERKTPAGQ